MRFSFRGPFARWPRASDAVLAVVLFAGALFLADGPNDSWVVRNIALVPFAVMLALAVAGSALYLRRQAPLQTLAIVLVCWLLLLLSDGYDIGFIMVAALYSVGRYVVDVRLALAGLGASMTVLAIDGLTTDTTWGETTFGVVFMFVIWYIGRRLRLRTEHAAQRHRQLLDETRRIVAEERTHIARELHDVVAHQVSMMTVQAGAAQAVAAVDPDGAREAMAAVERAGRQTLEELRHLLGVLRPEPTANGVGPQPGLADVPRLIEQVGNAGVDVTIVDDIRSPLPTRVQLSAYRIVQEALTNVLKHGGPGTRAEVDLREDGPEVVIEVTDSGDSGAPTRAPGHGLIGMRERATLLGGTLEAGPRPEGGFRVVARLPRDGTTA
ncbi:sensor histidine kinase [Cryptosporangium sp. NPDC048952]|uniref:sensor histidine kinase n=1 Tax=Cryptosporangium sp. NPDC048952 TaxID=3363961 RepID=UPI00371EC661